MSTPLFPLLEKRISDNMQAIINSQVIPWVFMTSGKPFRIKRFDGREIAYEGLAFEGSPQDVFWSRYVEPFLEDEILKELAFVIETCQKRQIDALSVLSELEGLLVSLCRKVFASMADVDRRLRGGGYPERLVLRSIDSELTNMIDFIKVHIEAERAMWKPKAWHESWYDKNKFWVWFIGILFALAGLAVKFF